MDNTASAQNDKGPTHNSITDKEDITPVWFTKQYQPNLTDLEAVVNQQACRQHSHTMYSPSSCSTFTITPGFASHTFSESSWPFSSFICNSSSEDRSLVEPVCSSLSSTSALTTISDCFLAFSECLRSVSRGRPRSMETFRTFSPLRTRRTPSFNVALLYRLYELCPPRLWVAFTSSKARSCTAW